MGIDGSYLLDAGVQATHIHLHMWLPCSQSSAKFTHTKAVHKKEIEKENKIAPVKYTKCKHRKGLTLIMKERFLSSDYREYNPAVSFGCCFLRSQPHQKVIFREPFVELFLCVEERKGKGHIPTQVREFVLSIPAHADIKSWKYWKHCLLTDFW